MRNEFIVFSILSTLTFAALGQFVWAPFWYVFILLGPIILMGTYDMAQTKHTIMRNFPVLGRGRYLMEDLRPKIYQYFIESDTDGKPINRTLRTVVYQRAKKTLDTEPFGTKKEIYQEGHEWMHHSIGAKDHHDLNPDPRTTIGGPACQKPYAASIFNISAMSYGSLSKNAILALNGGAKLGNFAHNTGEGSISEYHHKFGGDLIYQVGTGYFGCRTEDGNFSPEKFKEIVSTENVRMIELKLSQGAKPGHGGILPAKKNTPEIAKIRGVKPGTDVHSPPYHKAFSTPTGLLQFIQQMRELSGGKPVGFKLCIGKRSDFFAICKAMVATQIFPDFITIDGAEGGTGAAPLEFSNSVGMPFKDGLAFAYDALVGFGIKEHIKLFAAGKILTGFHIFRAMALGADATYTARGMMLALGCIQALECNTNHCPVGVTSQKPELTKGLVVSEKKVRVANFHRETVEAFTELLAAAGLTEPNQITRSHIFRRTSMIETKQYDEIFPEIPPGVLKSEATVPDRYLKAWKDADPTSF